MPVTGKTKQFQNLSNNVKNASSEWQKTMLNADQVNQLFNDFWYQPEKSDLTYWSNQPETAKTKLVWELKKRKDEALEVQKNQELTKQWPTHMTDQQISKLYSEYGFPIPKSSSDYNWIRQNLPDNEEKLRSVLEIQKKTMDQMLKIKGKNTVDTVKQATSQSPSQPIMTGGNVTPNNGMLINNQFSWQWWPTDGWWQWWSTRVVFPSRYAVVKFSWDPNWADEWDASTLWLLDSNTRQIQPFLSMTWFNNLFWENSKEALKKVVNLNPNDLLQNWDLWDFTLLSNSYWINDNWDIPTVETNQQNIKSLYWKTPDAKAVNTSYTALDWFFSLLKQNNWSGIDTNTINSALNDHNQVAQYISALAYGGYSVNDVYRDLKRKDLISKWDQSLKNVQVINPNIDKNSFLNTQQWQMSQWIATIDPPASFWNISSSLLNSPITQLPKEAFDTLVPPIDINSPDFKDQMDKVQSAFHDILMEQSNASTEAEKTAADSKYKDYQDYIEQNYGIRISMDAAQAWQQLQSIGQQSEINWVTGSGIQNSQVDDELKQTRIQDSKYREQMVNAQESAEADNAKTSASSSDIKRMNDEDNAKWLPKEQWRAYRWGLVPSDDVLKNLDINTLKQKYPNASEDDLNNMRSQILDENGNYRSTLYQNRSDNLSKIKYGGTMADMLPSMGDLQTFKEKKVLDANDAAQKKASAPYTMGDSWDPFANLWSERNSVPTWTDNKILTQPAVNYNAVAKNEINKTFPDNTQVTAKNNFSPSNTPEAINGVKYNTKALQQSAYSNIKPVGNTLYGTPKVQPTSTPNTTAPTFSIKPWTSYIPNVASMSKYKNIYKDTTPGSNKLYWTLI